MDNDLAGFSVDRIVEELSSKAVFESSPLVQDLEKKCWSLVHEYRHGFLPSEYDIREIDEDLYLSVLALAKVKIKLQTH